MAKMVVFNEDTAKKILGVTRKQLGLPVDFEGVTVPQLPEMTVYVVTIDSVVSGQYGKYNGTVYLVQIAPTTGALTLTQLKDSGNSGTACYVWNTPENGKSTHWVKAGSVAVATKAGINYNDKDVYFTECYEGVTSSPSTLGAASEGTEAADTKSWSRDTATSGDAYGATPLDVWVVSRVGYFHAGDKKLYQYMRKMTYNAAGLLVAVSAETRGEVDAAGPCTGS